MTKMTKGMQGFQKGHTGFRKYYPKGYHLTEEHKKKIGLASKGRWHTPEAKLKQRIAKLGNKNPSKRFEVRRKISDSLKGNILSAETKQKLSLSNKKAWEKEGQKENQLKAIFKGLNVKPNKPEQILAKLIQENNLPFNYVGDGKIWFRGKITSFNPDFLSKNPKHIIEMFGDYWHNREDSKLRDIERLQTYSKYGYKTLVIWEHELKDKELVVDKIRTFVGGDCYCGPKRDL